MQRAEMIFYDTVVWNDSAARIHETRLGSVTRFDEMNRIKMEITLNYKTQDDRHRDQKYSASLIKRDPFNVRKEPMMPAF